MSLRRVGGCCGTDWYRISGDQHIFLLGLLTFVASGPSLLFPESCFSPAPLSREWDFY